MKFYLSDILFAKFLSINLVYLQKQLMELCLKKFEHWSHFFRPNKYYIVVFLKREKKKGGGGKGKVCHGSGV